MFDESSSGNKFTGSERSEFDSRQWKISPFSAIHWVHFPGTPSRRGTVTIWLPLLLLLLNILQFLGTVQHVFLGSCVPVGWAGLQDAALYLGRLWALAVTIRKTGHSPRELQEDLALNFPFPEALSTRYAAGSPLLRHETIRRDNELNSITTLREVAYYKMQHMELATRLWDTQVGVYGKVCTKHYPSKPAT
jgi:hypothetical protein